MADDDNTPLLQRVQYLSDKNQKKMTELRNKGFTVNADSIMQMRFDMLIDTLLGKPEDSTARLKFEERFHETLEKAIENTAKQAEQKAARSRLHVPGDPRNGRPK